MKSLIVYGPQGCGKTTNKEELRSRHGLKHVCELENFSTPASVEEILRREVEDVLFLTNLPAEWAEHWKTRLGVRVMSFEDAMRTITTLGADIRLTGRLTKPVDVTYSVDWKEVDELRPRSREDFEQQFMQQPSPTFRALDDFMGAMARKLEKHRMEKGDGWRTVEPLALVRLFNEELRKDEPDYVDIANYAMMIWSSTQPPVKRKVGMPRAMAAPYGGELAERRKPLVDIYKDVALGAKINAGVPGDSTMTHHHGGPCPVNHEEVEVLVRSQYGKAKPVLKRCMPESVNWHWGRPGSPTTDIDVLQWRKV